MVTRGIAALSVLGLATTADARTPITAGLKAGVNLSQPFSELGTGPEITVEGGYVLPWIEQRLRVLLQIGWIRTKSDRDLDQTNTGSNADNFPPEGPDGSYSYKVTEDELMITPAFYGQLWPRESKVWTPYATLGPRIYMLRTRVDGQEEASGADFGRSTEKGTKAGLQFTAGVEYKLWRGSLLGELALGWSFLDHRTTGHTNTGSLGINFGYRLMF